MLTLLTAYPVLVWGPTPARTSATAEISISAPLSAHALRFCATSPQGSGGVEEARHLHTAHYITSHTKAVPSFLLSYLLACAGQRGQEVGGGGVRDDLRRGGGLLLGFGLGLGLGFGLGLGLGLGLG